MADEIVVTVNYGRKKQVAPYEMSEASVIIEERFRGDADPEDIERSIKAKFIAAKSQVYLELGLPFEQDSDTGIVFEVFPGSEVVASKAQPALSMVRRIPNEPEPYETAEAAPMPAASVAHPSNSHANIVPKDEKEALFLDVMQNPGNWQRVTSDNAKAPDFRHKTKTRPNSTYKISLWEKDAPFWFTSPI